MNLSTEYPLNPFPSARIIRRMGLSGDQDGIMNRYINEEGHWQEHLNHSKNYIKKTVKDQKYDNVAILGSGWLLDVPLHYLSEHCENVFLYDIRHPKPIINKTRQYSNVELITMDITGGIIEFIYHRVKQKQFTEIGHVPKVLFKPVKNVDLLISLNILNQLDILIVEYLRKYKEISEPEIVKLRSQIQQNHLNSLSKQSSVLITDYEEIIFDRTGREIKKSSLVFSDFPKGRNQEEWIWRFDNQMTYYPNRKTHFKVKAIQL
ncbi:MAG TPA: hypothetical protein DDX98_04725 [Bacteroidales bacterium]|jgi:hypothetical protein|nr:hypothetical protein [Bacteroidales bacterium]